MAATACMHYRPTIENSSGHAWLAFRGKLIMEMDQEEPGAAQVIAFALNKRNEVAMKTGHLEIRRTLVARCRPDPDGTVLLQPVRDTLIDLYGAAVEHPSFVDAFKFVLAGGGADSPHEGLGGFHFRFCEPENSQDGHRGIRESVPIWREVAEIKNACVKWSWRQAGPKGGLCPVPPNISHRLAKGGKSSCHERHRLKTK